MNSEHVNGVNPTYPHLLWVEVESDRYGYTVTSPAYPGREVWIQEEYEHGDLPMEEGEGYVCDELCEALPWEHTDELVGVLCEALDLDPKTDNDLPTWSTGTTYRVGDKRYDVLSESEADTAARDAAWDRVYDACPGWLLNALDVDDVLDRVCGEGPDGWERWLGADVKVVHRDPDVWCVLEVTS